MTFNAASQLYSIEKKYLKAIIIYFLSKKNKSFATNDFFDYKKISIVALQNSIEKKYSRAIIIYFLSEKNKLFATNDFFEYKKISIVALQTQLRRNIREQL